MRIVGNWIILRTGLKINYASGSFPAGIVKCLSCGLKKKSRLATSILVRAKQGCRNCDRLKKKAASLASRPKIGIVVGNRTVIQNDLWLPQSNGNRFAACLVECNNCKWRKTIRLTGLASSHCVKCNHPSKRRPAPILCKQLTKGLELMTVFNRSRSAKSQCNLINWVVLSSKPKHTKNKPVLKHSPNSKIMNFLLPITNNTPCVWPWDDFGNPLSDAELKKAVRKAKREWKKTHANM